MSTHLEALRNRFIQAALGYPDSVQEAPWGERVVKVRKKIFLFASLYTGRCNLGLKVPVSNEAALALPNTKPMSYGMGKHGWVTFSYGPDDEVPEEILLAFLHESFCSVATKKLVAEVGDTQPDPAPQPEPIDLPDGDPTVVLIGDDPYRIDRAQRGLAEVGVHAVAEAVGPDAVQLVGDIGPDVLLLDLSRNATEVLAIAGEAAMVAMDARIIVTGVRDKKLEAKALDAVPNAFLCTKNAPGEPAVIQAVAGR